MKTNEQKTRQTNGRTLAGALILACGLPVAAQAANPIWINPMTCGEPIASYYLGDSLSSPWYVNFEIGQQNWNYAQVGYGTAANGSDYNWGEAGWYEDGSYPNKRVRRDIGGLKFTATGNWYLICQAKEGSGDTYTTGSACGWQNGTTYPPASMTAYFTVSALVAPSNPSASQASSSQIDLEWTKGVSGGSSKDTIIFRSTSATAPTPVGGTSYSSGSDYSFGGNTYRCVYIGNGTSTSDASLSAGTKYYYYFFAENYSYYSAGVTANACTAVTIGTQPANAAACVGSTAQFSVTPNAGTTPTYKWQVDKGSGWTDCTASDGSNYDTATFTTAATTSGMNGYKYRCAVTDACGTTAVNTDGNATLTVNTKSTDPTSASAVPSTICSGESVTLTLTGGGGGTSTTVKWYASGCGSGTAVATGNGASVNPTETTTYYGRYEDPAPCSYNTACASATVTVNPASVGGTATAVDSSVCSGDAPTISLSDNVGNVVKWQYSSDNFASDVHDIANTTTTLDNAPTITATTYYRAVVQNSTCSEANSLVATVTIQSSTPNIFDWRAEADSGNWVWPGTGDYPWYSNPNYFTEPENEVHIKVDNNVQLAWYNDVSSLTINKLEYGSSATEARTLTGNALSFADLCGTEPAIVNNASATHVINVDLEGDDTEPLNIGATGGGLTFGGDIDNNGQDLLVATLNGKVVSMSGEISGAGGLAKYDNGSLTLSGANTYSGGTTITGANSKVYVSGDGNLGDTSGDILIDAGEEGGLWITGATTLNAGRTLTIDEYGGCINVGANTVTINGPVVNNAVWAASTDRQFYIKADTGGTVTLAGELTGDGDLVKKLAGTLVMNEVNENYTGDIYLDKGTIETAVADAFGATGWINLGADLSGNNGATILNYTEDEIDVDNTINIRGYTDFNDTKSILVDTACDVNFDGTVYLHDSLTLTTDGTGTMTFNGALTKGAGEGSGGKQTTFLSNDVVKTGNGTVFINGVNSYDGLTSVSNGVWVVSSGASSANSAHVVDATADGSSLLMGEGTIGALTLQNDGAVSPGDSTGVDQATLTVNGAANLGGTGGGTYECDITGLGSTDCDLIDASGSVTAGSAGLTVNLPTTAPSEFDPNEAYYWIIATGDSGSSAANMIIGTAWDIPEDAILAIEEWPRTGGDWIVVTYTTPTRVVLYSFTLDVENGVVVARWRTASEQQTVGFWLERQDGNAWVRMNDEIIYARGEDGLGASYARVDSGAAPGGTYVYRLIELENDGGRQIHGPFERIAGALTFKDDNPITQAENGMVLRWLSREDEFYRILRSTNLLEGLDGFRPVATGIPATPPVNEYLDQDAGSLGIYTIQVDEE